MALLPLFASYASGIPGFSLADVILVLFTMCALLKIGARDNNRMLGNIGALYIGIALILLFDVIAVTSNKGALYDVSIRTIRYCFYVFCFIYTSKKLIDVEMLKKCVKNVSVLATIYIILQYVMYHVFDKVLNGFLPWLELYVEDYGTKDYESIYEAMFRPTSFFLEPAHFARYAIIGLIIILWAKDLKIKDMFFAVFVSVGVLISTSSLGYLLLAMVWVSFALTRLVKIKKSWAKLCMILAVLIAPVALYVIFQLPYVQDTIMRSLSGDINDTNTAIGARLNGFSHFAELSILGKIFGVGFGCIPEGAWLSSAAYWLYGSGIIVFSVYLVFLLSSLLRLKNEKKMILLIMFFLFFSDDSFYSYMCIIYYSLSLLTERVSYEKDPVYSDGIKVG